MNMLTGMKRWLCVVLAVLLCVSLMACGEPGGYTGGYADTEPQENNDSNKPSDPSVPSDPTEPSTPADPKEPVDVTFFDDAAFIGDSVTLKLNNYHVATGALSKTTFLCVGSYSVNNAVTNGLYLSYRGQQMTPQDALAACGAKKVFILLGMNDIALFGENSVSVAMDNWATMLGNIRAKNPEIEIYIQSGTPIYTAGQKGGLNNQRMDAYNVALKAFAEANNCHYIDIATPMKDSTNGLKAEYCSDAYVHFTDAACQLWISLLLDYLNS